MIPVEGWRRWMQPCLVLVAAAWATAIPGHFGAPRDRASGFPQQWMRRMGWARRLSPSAPRPVTHQTAPTENFSPLPDALPISLREGVGFPARGSRIPPDARFGRQP